MTARDTSIEAYQDLILAGKRPKQWMTIFHAVRLNGQVTRDQLAYLTNLRLASVCGRVKELIDEGLLVDDEIVLSSTTGAKVHAVKIAANQRELF